MMPITRLYVVSNTCEHLVFVENLVIRSYWKNCRVLNLAYLEA